MEHRKKERKVLKKRKKEREKGKKERKRKTLRVYSNKGKVNILRGKNTSTLKIFFWCDFLPFHHTISKTLSKIIEKVFLAIFGPSFNLAIYMTWVVPFLLTHELHIFSP
jgi:hypothetical protein